MLKIVIPLHVIQPISGMLPVVGSNTLYPMYIHVLLIFFKHSSLPNSMQPPDDGSVRPKLEMVITSFIIVVTDWSLILIILRVTLLSTDKAQSCCGLRISVSQTNLHAFHFALLHATCPSASLWPHQVVCRQKRRSSEWRCCIHTASRNASFPPHRLARELFHQQLLWTAFSLNLEAAVCLPPEVNAEVNSESAYSLSPL